MHDAEVVRSVLGSPAEDAPVLTSLIVGLAQNAKDRLAVLEHMGAGEGHPVRGYGKHPLRDYSHTPCVLHRLAPMTRLQRVEDIRRPGLPGEQA